MQMHRGREQRTSKAREPLSNFGYNSMLLRMAQMIFWYTEYYGVASGQEIGDLGCVKPKKLVASVSNFRRML